MGATGNREYTVFSTNYWRIRMFMIIMFDSHSLPPSCIMYSITGRHVYFIVRQIKKYREEEGHIIYTDAVYIHKSHVSQKA